MRAGVSSDGGGGRTECRDHILQQPVGAASTEWSIDHLKTMWDWASALTDLSEFVSVHLRWVKGHSGIHGNKKADQLARKTAGSEGQVPDWPIPRSAIYHLSETRVTETIFLTLEFPKILFGKNVLIFPSARAS